MDAKLRKIEAWPGDPVPAQTAGKATVGGAAAAVSAALGLWLSRQFGPDLVTPDLQLAVDAVVSAAFAGVAAWVGAYFKRNFLK